MEEKQENILKAIGIISIPLCIVFIAVCLVLIAQVLNLRTAEPTPIVETRVIEATVCGVSTDETNVLFADKNGNLWSADCETPMHKGQKVMIELSSNGTEQIEDDEILNVWLT